MKKLLAIILAVVCIIPTMAVSFSVSAKAATNNVNSKDAFMYQYSEKTYTVKKTKAQQKYKFNYSVSNNKDNSVIVVKNDDKTKFQVTDIPMRELADYNTIEYDDGIFYNDQIGVKKGGTVDAFKTIKQKVLTDSYTGINFKPDDYKITYKIKDTSIATVNSKGVIKGKKVGDTRFEFTIKFSDGSTFSDFAELGVY